ncbi:SAM-dependent methyltransferase [Chlamydiota bacterium]
MTYKKKDYYAIKAKEEKYPARSVYKLQEIDKKQSLIKKGYIILDLGCCPGSWLKYCSAKIGPSGKVIGIDTQTLSLSIPPNAQFIQEDIFSSPAINTFATKNTFFDLIISDLAPATSGIKNRDHQRSLQLAFRALEIAEVLLKPGSNFLCKFFQGEDNNVLFVKIKSLFSKMVLEKPKSSRKQSVELFVVGLGKKIVAST